MIRKTCIYLSFVLMLLLVASCSTTKNAKKSDSIDNLSETEYMEKVLANSAEWDAITAKMSINIKLNGKSSGKVSGMLRIKRGEIIQMSITPLLGIEMGRAEILPDGILVIDRMNKRYVRVSFSELKALTNVNLNFHVLEALFLNEVFLPNKETLTARDWASFDISVEQPDVWLDAKKTKPFSYRFRTEVSDARLKESRISLPSTNYALSWQYGDFETLGQHTFPTSMFVSFEGGSKPSNASFSLSRLSVNGNWEAHTEVSSKYQKVELEELVKMLVK